MQWHHHRAGACRLGERGGRSTRWLTPPRFCHHQLALVTGTAAAGLSQQCISSMSSTAFADISDSFAAALTVSQCGGFSSSQLGGVRAAAFGSLTRSCIAGITSQACGALTADQVCGCGWVAGCLCRGCGCVWLCVAVWRWLWLCGCVAVCTACASNNRLTPCVCRLCPGLLSQVGYLTADNTGGLTQSCVSNTGGVWGKISSAALGAMAIACGGFDETSMASVNPAAMAGMTLACARSLPGSNGQDSACGGLTAAQIGYLTADAGAGLQSQCIGATGAVWGEASTALVGSLSSACTGFDSTNLHSVRATSFAAWKASCTSMWSGENGYGACTGITSTQVGGVATCGYVYACACACACACAKVQ